MVAQPGAYGGTYAVQKNNLEEQPSPIANALNTLASCGVKLEQLAKLKFIPEGVDTVDPENIPE
jgi:hypothetical protein